MHLECGLYSTPPSFPCCFQFPKYCFPHGHDLPLVNGPDDTKTIRPAPSDTTRPALKSLFQSPRSQHFRLGRLSDGVQTVHRLASAIPNVKAMQAQNHLYYDWNLSTTRLCNHNAESRAGLREE